MIKRTEHQQAVSLRREGTTYQAIQQRLGVAKSTVWRWLKAEGFVETHPQRLTELKRIAQRKGAAVVKARRLTRTREIMDEASREINQLSWRDLWLMGVVLYWAEGAKQKPGNVSARVTLSNSDPGAIRLFMVWLREICGISEDRLSFDIYLHETADGERARTYWATQLQVPIEKLSRIRWKRHRPATRRTNVGDSYHGLVRAQVSRSTALNRRIAGWVAGISRSLGSGVMATRLTLDQKIPGSTPGSPASIPDDLVLYDGEPRMKSLDLPLLTDGPSVTDDWLADQGAKRTR